MRSWLLALWILILNRLTIMYMKTLMTETFSVYINEDEATHFMLLLLSRFSRVWLCATPQTAAHQAPPSLGFSRQEYWGGLPFPSPMHENEKWKWSCSVVSDPQLPHGLQPPRLLCPWDFPVKSTGVGWYCLLHEVRQKRFAAVYVKECFACLFH